MEYKSDFIIKFRGTRGSFPVAKANFLEFGGNTACVEVHCGKQLIILDAGTGIIDVGDDEIKNKILLLEEKLDEYKNIMKDENDIKRRIGEFKSIFKKKNILTEFDSVVFNSITDKIIIGEKDEFDVLNPNVIKFVFRNGKEVKQALPRKLNSKQTVIEKYAEEIRKQQSSASSDEKNIIQVNTKEVDENESVEFDSIGANCNNEKYSTYST